ncbi:hypothetical protein [Burkholderia cepacia]|uniref:hypothetical protein n=1 Tax=Burkholderia cepacia TaxID=292 RepID=UPI000757476E|nr:hypothetical protein [Burkholderia cepacia]
MSNMRPRRFLTQDEIDAIEFWADKEYKKWAVDVEAGPERRPTYRQTFYARTRTSHEAINAVKNGMVRKVPRARFHARLAGPRELGCQRVGGANGAE